MKNQLEIEYPNVNEITLKYETKVDIDPIQITSPEDAFVFFRSIWNDYIKLKESFYVCLVDSQKYAIGYAMISLGGQTATIVDPAEVLRIALLGPTHSFIVAHNHPSGSLKPSKSDIKLTERIEEGGKLLGIQMLDHILMSDSKCFSMREENII